MKTWTNIADKTLRNRLGYQTANKLKDNLINILEARPWRPTADNATWLAYKDANTYTVKAGYYLVGDSLYQLVADLDWTWAAAGQNRGMDDGGAGNVASTWYFLYGIVYLGAFGVVASATAPTSRFNTNLSGASYDTNLYLGAIYNDASQNLLAAYQNGNKMLYAADQSCGSTASTSYTSKTLLIPSIAALGILRLLNQGTGSTFGCGGYYSIDGTNEFIYTGVAAYVDANQKGRAIGFDAPHPTSRTGWIKTGNAAITTYLYARGWYDSFLWN